MVTWHSVVNVRITGYCALVVMAGVLFALPLPLPAASGTHRVASRGKPVAAADGWPEGVLALVNDPARTDGWRPWFSGLPNAITYYCFVVNDTEDVNRLVRRLAKVKADVLQLRLRAGQHRAVQGGSTVSPQDEGAAVVFSIGDQASINRWYQRLPEVSPGVRQFGVHRYTKPPAALPPTLTIYVGHKAVDLDRLKVPPNVRVQASISDARQEDARVESPADRVFRAEPRRE